MQNNKALGISMVFRLIYLKNLELIWVVGLILDGQIFMNPKGYLRSNHGRSPQDGQQGKFRLREVTTRSARGGDAMELW
jgi:hypothetical protein